MTRLIDTLLLLALPASGKSEVRRYLAHLSPEQARQDFHLGETVQLDDYPYVHMMRRVSQELRALGQPPVFFANDEDPMLEPRDWGMLIELLNEDHEDLLQRRRHRPAGAASWLLDRYDAARSRVGAKPAFVSLPPAVRARLQDALEREAAELLESKNAGIPETLQGRTVVIEFARGGRQGATMPLPAPFGYRYSLSRLSPQILQRASILYIWVTPEESRRKNAERADPNNPGSILHHGVPMRVMLEDYGCDDMEWLISQSDRPGTVRIEAHGQTFYLPVARFDNRQDKTTFVRADRSAWRQQDVAALHAGLKEALDRLVATL
ncbi:MAG: hypothetical protein RMK29_19670 [Myxococcales bacterium]|nr:hypothetical protein [Myxococcota bacterium]MDW8283927.1 hypothetical protein [Myxococcales bacterium]